METQQASGGSMLGLGIIILIIFLLFPGFVIWLLWLAIIVMIVGGIVAFIAG